MGKKPHHFTDSLYYDIEKTAKFFRYFAAAMFKKLEADFTPDEFTTLDTIICNSGICQRDLAKLILKDRANTGRILDSLEEKGLIKRFIDVKNNRLVRKMSATDKGNEIFLDFTKRFGERIKNSIICNVNVEEIDNVREVLKKVRDDLSRLVDTQI